LVFHYNNSSFARYRAIEDVDPSSISASLNVSGYTDRHPYLEPSTPWNESENFNAGWSDSDLTLGYPLSEIGQPNELTGQVAKGRRIRVSATNGKTGIQDMNIDGAWHLSTASPFYQFENRSFKGLSWGENASFSKSFCYSAYTSCDSNRLSPSVRATYTAPPPAISEGDVTGRDEDPRTDSPTTTAPEKDGTPADTTPSARSEKTKKTIKKKY